MNRKIAILSICVFLLLSISCSHNGSQLTVEEREQIKTEVVASIETHVADIINQDYEKVMEFYVKENYILFGDGKYWGDYNTVDDIWGTWLPKWQKITEWELKNHKVQVFSRDGAIDYVEWTHERIEEDGDTTKAYGSWAWAMKKFPEGWKSSGAMIDHRYTAGPITRNNE